jgi:hypothetical protein
MHSLACSSHSEFRLGDIEALDPTRETFDAVVYVLGYFFCRTCLPESTISGDLFDPAARWPHHLGTACSGARQFRFWLAVRDERPDLDKGYNPWDRINEPAALAALLLESGVGTAKIVVESDVQSLDPPEEFWTIALGSGYRSVN